MFSRLEQSNSERESMKRENEKLKKQVQQVRMGRNHLFTGFVLVLAVFISLPQALGPTVLAHS